MNLSELKAIDFHSHFNHGSPLDPAETEIYKFGLDFLKKGYDYANISSVGFSTYAGVLSNKEVAEENDYLYNLALDTPWIYQWVVIEPRHEETFEQAKKMLDSPKCLGLKIHSPCHEYSIAEYADKIFSFADERGAVVLMHPDRMELMPEYADRYKNMKLVIAHLGTVDHVNAIETAKYGNIYTDTSGVASSNNNILEYAISRIGTDRILFGTDTYAAGCQRGRIEYAPIPEQDKIKILRENAITLCPQLKNA